MPEKPRRAGGKGAPSSLKKTGKPGAAKSGDKENRTSGRRASKASRDEATTPLSKKSGRAGKSVTTENKRGAPDSKSRRTSSAKRSGTGKGGTGKPGTGTTSTKSGGKKKGEKSAPGKAKTNRASIGIAVKFTLPVAIVVAAMIGMLAFFLARQTTSTIMNEMLKDGVSTVTGLGVLGRSILLSQDDPMWPVTLKLVPRETFFKAAEVADTGGNVELTERQAQRARLSTGPLRDFISRASSETGAQSHILAAFILRGRDPFATSRTLPLTLSLEEMANQSGFEIAPSNFLPKYATYNSYSLAGTRYQFGTGENRVQVHPSELRMDGQTFRILRFVLPIHDFNNRPLGEAHIGVDANAVLTGTQETYRLLWTTGTVAVVLSVLCCVVVGYLVSQPAKLLIRDMEIVAKGDLTHKTRSHSQDEFGMIASEFNEMTHKLYQASLMEKEQARLENELEMACEIQMKLLPPRLPAVKGFDMFAVYRPAKEVGGDYYDFFQIDKTHMGIIVADVSGKGIPGSMVMATTRTILRFMAAGNTSAADTLAKTNAMVALDIKRGMFVTAFYIVLDAVNKRILCSSAGHNPMVLHRADDSILMVNPNGIALGFDKGMIFSRTIKEEEIQLEQGDRVVLYTDGVVEAMDINHEEYTEERFCAFVKKAKKLNSEQFINALLKDLDRHKGRAEQHDDITVVTFRIE